MDTLDIPEPTGRRCGRCKVVRPLAMFYLTAEQKRAEREGRSRFLMPCRLCQREINSAIRKPRQDYTDAVKVAAGCADCGIRSEHPEIYDFDHLDHTSKVNAISNLMTKGAWGDFLAEIAKCEVVCANCHRIRTRAREKPAFGQTRKPRAPERSEVPPAPFI